MAKKPSRNLTTKQKAWLWTKRGTAAAAIGIVIREAYLGFGPRRDYRRAVFEEARRRATELGRPLLVLGNPDGGLVNRLLGRQWQCGDVCVDPQGCGICGDWVQGRPEEVLRELDSNAYVVFDPGAFAFADVGSDFVNQLARVSGGEVFMADAGPWTMTAFLEPRRKRRLLKAPQANQGLLEWKPLPWQPELDSGRATMQSSLKGSPTGYLGNVYDVHVLSGLGYGQRFG